MSDLFRQPVPAAAASSAELCADASPAELPARSRVRFALLINSLGGGCIGLAAVSPLASGAESGFANALLLILLVGLFAFGVFAGFALSVPGASGLRWMRSYLLLQAPVLSSPLLGYQLVSGLGLPLSIGVIGSGLDMRLTFTWAPTFGSAGWVSFAQGAPLGIGVNVVPIVLLMLTSWALKRGAKAAPLRASGAAA